MIGGQAVNYWCEVAYRKSPELKAHHPFTSEDLDVVARQRAQTLAVAKATGLRLVEMDQGYAGTDRAALVDANADTVIQVLGGMYGVTDADLVRDTAEVIIQDLDRQERVAKIANRTALVKGKIALTLAPDGVRPPDDREHYRFHLRLLILCLAIATRELVEGIGQIHDERSVIKSLKALLKVFRGADAQRVCALDPTIDWKQAIAPEILTIQSDRYPRLLPWINAGQDTH